MKTLWTLKGLACKLGIRAEVLEELALHAPRRYQPYFKKKPGKKPRKIANPSCALKEVQRIIYRTLLRPLEVPAHLHGGVTGRSPLTNALQHLGKAYVVRIDVRDFFPSITDNQVYNVWRKLGYGPRPAGILTALTTLRRQLPQGAPTSSSLANLVLLDPDSEIQRGADLAGCVFTRFIDDLALSGDRPQVLVENAIRILSGAGFRVSHKKLAVMPRAHLQELTGLGLNSRRGPSVPRYRRSRVRAAIHQLERVPGEKPPMEQISSVRGRIQHIAKTNPGSASALLRQLFKKIS